MNNNFATFTCFFKSGCKSTTKKWNVQIFLIKIHGCGHIMGFFIKKYLSFAQFSERSFGGMCKQAESESNAFLYKNKEGCLTTTQSFYLTLNLIP